MPPPWLPGAWTSWLAVESMHLFGLVPFPVAFAPDMSRSIRCATVSPMLDADDGEPAPDPAVTCPIPWLVVDEASPADFGATLTGGVYDCINAHNVPCLVRNGVDYALLDSCTPDSDTAWATSGSKLVSQNGCLSLFQLAD